MRIKWGQDMATGVLFILVGIGALLTIYYYDKLSMGSAQRPGTGVLPAILSWCLIGTGLFLSVKSIVFSDEPVTRMAWRPFLLVTLGVVLFGLLIDDWGLVVTMVISMTLCALGTVETRWIEFAIFSLIMIAIGWGMFIWLLGMPINTWPTKAVPSFLSAVLR
jgi:putative tricarboxylic transport membrane protein